METIKKNITFVLGISIPVLMILFVAASIYLPRFFAPQPKVNFLYTSEDRDYYYGNVRQYGVQNGKIIEIQQIPQPEKRTSAFLPSDVAPPALPLIEPKFFVHDVIKNESKEISFDQTQELNLDSRIKSSDGFEVVYGNRDNGFPFFSGTDYNARYLKGHGVSTKLNLQSSGPYYNDNFQFLGWILDN